MSVNIVLKTILDDKGIKNAQKAFGKLGSTVTKLAGALGLAFSTKALIDSAKAAAQDAKSQALLANQLRNTLQASDDLIASVEQSINKMSMSAAVADDELRPAFSQLVRVTGDAAQSQELLQLALDVSAATGRDLNSVTIALGKAYQGNTTALSRLGIKAEDGVDIFEQLKTQFAGAAETAARNDPFKRLSVIIGELQEQIGVYLLPGLNNLADYLQTAEFGEAFEDLAIKIGLAIEQVDLLFQQFTGNNTLTAITNLFAGISYEVAKLAILFQALGKSAGLWLTGRWIEAIEFNPATYVKDQIALLDKEIARRKIASGSNRIQAALKQIKDSNDDDKKQPKQVESQFQKVQKIIKEYQGKLTKAEQDYTRTKFEINRAYQETLLDLEEDYIERRGTIVESSINRLRDAFRGASAASIGDLFGTSTVTELETSVKKLTDRLTVTVTKETEKTVGGTVTDLIASLSSRLAASRALLTNASALASKGFSQTFIEQVVETGTDTGNALASAILKASPEQQAALKKNFLDLEEVSETGIDSLAKSLNSGVTLATRELNKQLKDLQDEYDKNLEDEYKRLQTALADAGYAFTLNITGIKSEFSAVIDELDGKFGGLGKTIDALLAKMGQLSGVGLTDIQKALIDPKSGTAVAGATIATDVAAKSVKNSVGLIIDSAADIAPTMDYLAARIEAANKYIKSGSLTEAQRTSATATLANLQAGLTTLKGAAGSEAGAAGTVINNITVKVDTKASEAMVGKTLGKLVTTYTQTGGKVLVSGQQ